MLQAVIFGVMVSSCMRCGVLERNLMEIMTIQKLVNICSNHGLLHLVHQKDNTINYNYEVAINLVYTP